MNRRIIFIIGSIIFAILLLIGSTYAMFYRSNKLAGMDNYATGNLSIVLDNNESGLGDVVNLNNISPVIDSVGMNNSAYRFKITNNGNLDYKFDLILNSSGTLNPTYMRIQVDDGDAFNLSGSSTIILSDAILYAGKSLIVSIKFWLDKNTPSDGIDKSFSASLSTSGIGIKVSASDRVIRLAGDCNSWSASFSGVCATNSYNDNGVTKYHDYRYIGNDVDNYVKFNGDLYQIIGVFDDYTHGVTGERLVKLVSVNSFNSFSWGVKYILSENEFVNSDSNDWTENSTTVPSNANLLLNKYFLGQNLNVSTYGHCTNWSYIIYVGSTDAYYLSHACDNIVNYGIKNRNLNYIKNVKWNLKGFDTSNASNTKQNWYSCERTTTENCSSGNNGSYSSVYEAKIGLMYPSDYLYASGSLASSSTTTSNYVNYASLNWLYLGYEWLLGVVGSDSQSVYYVSNGGISSTYNYNSFNIRPVFYLRNDVYFSDGDGSFDNPYVVEGSN